MTNEEFKIWFKHHTSAFTWIGDKLAKMPTVPRHDADATSRTTFAAWRSALAQVPLQVAMDATDALFRGVVPEPKGFDDHPRAILRYWHANQPKPADDPTRVSRRTYRVDDEPVYDCPACLDEGAIQIYDQHSVSDMRRGQVKHREFNPTGKRSLYTAMAVCRCNAGQRFGIRADFEYFDELRHIPIGRETRHPDRQYLELQATVAAETLVPGVKEF